jgi:hypothetical protein
VVIDDRVPRAPLRAGRVADGVAVAEDRDDGLAGAPAVGESAAAERRVVRGRAVELLAGLVDEPVERHAVMDCVGFAVRWVVFRSGAPRSTTECSAPAVVAVAASSAFAVHISRGGKSWLPEP